MAITGLDEVRDLLRRLGINDASKPRRLSARHTHHAAMVGDHSNLDTANARMTGDHLLRIVSLKLIEMTFVKQTLQQFSYVVGLTMIFRNEIVEFFSRSQGLARLLVREYSSGFWQLRNKLPDLIDARLIVCNSIMGHTR